MPLLWRSPEALRLLQAGTELEGKVEEHRWGVGVRVLLSSLLC